MLGPKPLWPNNWSLVPRKWQQYSPKASSPKNSELERQPEAGGVAPTGDRPRRCQSRQPPSPARLSIHALTPLSPQRVQAPSRRGPRAPSPSRSLAPARAAPGSAGGERGAAAGSMGQTRCRARPASPHARSPGTGGPAERAPPARDEPSSPRRPRRPPEPRCRGGGAGRGPRVARSLKQQGAPRPARRAARPLPERVGAPVTHRLATSASSAPPSLPSSRRRCSSSAAGAAKQPHLQTRDS